MLQFEQCLKRELATAEEDKSGFIKEFSEADFDAIVSGWKVCHSRVLHSLGVFFVAKFAALHACTAVICCDDGALLHLCL